MNIVVEILFIIIDKYLELIQKYPFLSPTESIWLWVVLLIFLLLLLLYVWQKVKEYKTKIKLPLLNMLGIHFQAHVNQVGCSGELAGCEFDENDIDFTMLFDISGKISNPINKKICDMIYNKCTSFIGVASKSKTAYVTGMSPIPYEVFAGTFLNGSNVNDYLEYDSKDSKKFYALKNRCSILQKFFGKHTLDYNDSENLIESKELNFIISVSSQITDEDVNQFQTFSNYKIELCEIKDNAITEKEQLIELKNSICHLMEQYGKKGYKRIHITAAIPTCLAVEIGKEIAHYGNRLPEIVVYHYVKTSEKKYTFGLIVNGSQKGSLYHV